MVYDVTIIGGGIVGLATALKIQEAHPGIKVVVLEKETAVGSFIQGFIINRVVQKLSTV